MNKILKLSAIALLASSTSLMAQSKSFEGTSIGIYAGTYGAAVNGSVVTGAGVSTSETNTGAIGKVGMIAGADLSYTFATGSNGFIALGATYIPTEAKFGSGDTNAGTNNTAATVSGKIKDPYSIYIQPGYAVNKDSALYAKVSYLEAKFDVTSSATITQQPGNLNGWGYGIGLKTMLTSNSFVQVEGNYSEYDTLTAKYTATGGQTNTVTAKPKVAQGLVTIGYKF
jgi:opacity protein-like surface antigen